MRTELDALLDDAVRRESIPYAVGAVVRSDAVIWEGASGEARPGQAAGTDTLFSLFSATKAIGALAMMIAVERHLFSLDSEVRQFVPWFEDVQVLDEMGPDGPVLRAPRRPVTVRHLLTHTSGFALGAFNEKVQTYLRETNTAPSLSGTLDSWKIPLMFDPGEGWAYGIGLEWSGYLLQAVTGIPIDQFCRENIFEPLEMRNTSFETDDTPGRPGQLYRRTDGRFEPSDFGVPSHPENYSFGFSIHSTAADYAKFLRLILNDGELDGTRIISPKTMRLMKDDQMLGGTIGPLETYVPDSHRVDHLWDRTPMTHSAMGLRTEADVPGMRASGSLWWAGFLNTWWWVDPQNDVAGVLFTQLLPFCDPGFVQTFADFELTAYQGLGLANAPSSVGDRLTGSEATA